MGWGVRCGGIGLHGAPQPVGGVLDDGLRGVGGADSRGRGPVTRRCR